MLNAALTGNIAGGKSTVAELFRSWGATMIDADEIVHDLQQPGQPLLERMVEAFGEAILTEDGALDRGAMRRRMSEDPEIRRRLNELVHPAVKERRDLLAAEAAERGAAIVVSVIPLLFESGLEGEFDVVVLVDAPEDLRRSRLVERRGMDPAEADRLIATQLPSDDKRGKADFVIDNAGTIDQLERKAAEVWARLKALAHPPSA